MNRYASTYISGLGEPIEQWLRESYDNVKKKKQYIINEKIQYIS